MYDIKHKASGTRGRLMLGMLVVASFSSCIGMGGCASVTQVDGTEGLGSDFGVATQHNMSAQFVAPSPEQKANTYIPPNAARQRLALETYEAGEVELETVITE